MNSMRRAAICCLIAVALPASAMADRPQAAALSVRTSDINLDTQEGVERLAVRFGARFKAICGSFNQAGLTYANTGGGLKEREACKAALRVHPDSHPGVKAAFALALERMN